MKPSKTRSPDRCCQAGMPGGGCKEFRHAVDHARGRHSSDAWIRVRGRQAASIAFARYSSRSRWAPPLSIDCLSPRSIALIMTRKILTAIIALLGFSAAAYAQSAAPQAAGVAWRGDELRACRQTALRLRADGWREVVQHPDLIWHLLTKNENYLGTS